MTALKPLALHFTLALLTGAACGGGAAPNGPDAGPDLAKIWQEIEACHLAGVFRIEARAGALCSEWPDDDETVQVVLDGEQPVLQIGSLVLPINQGLDDCVFVAAGCDASSDESTERYLAPTFELAKSEDGIELTASAIDVERGRVGPCGDASFTARAIPACDPLGTYTAVNPSAITAGTCDLEWGAGTVRIVLGTEGYDLSWGGTKLSGLQLDTSTCTLSGSEGTGSDFWFYNGAMRSAEIEIMITGEGLSGSVHDQLDGETFDGKSCAGATFALTASRPAPRERQRFAATCDIAKPVACGDGVCEVGESCACASDCGCQGELSCAPDGACRVSCTIVTEELLCGDGQRCSPIKDSPGTLLFPGDKLYCDQEGALAVGEICSTTTDCAAGLVCHYSPSATVAMCAAPCGEGFQECSGTGQICGAPGDGSGSTYDPSAIHACEHRAQIGEDCSNDLCAGGLSCLHTCLNDNCEDYCTPPCSGGCPPELPVCGSLNYCKRS